MIFIVDAEAERPQSRLHRWVLSIDEIHLVLPEVKNYIVLAEDTRSQAVGRAVSRYGNGIFEEGLAHVDRINFKQSHVFLFHAVPCLYLLAESGGRGIIPAEVLREGLLKCDKAVIAGIEGEAARMPINGECHQGLADVVGFYRYPRRLFDPGYFIQLVGYDDPLVVVIDVPDALLHDVGADGPVYARAGKKVRFGETNAGEADILKRNGTHGELIQQVGVYPRRLMVGVLDIDVALRMDAGSLAHQRFGQDRVASGIKVKTARSGVLPDVNRDNRQAVRQGKGNLFIDILFC